jgi:hypothetical protein
VLPDGHDRAPNEAYVQLLEKQCLAIRDTKNGFLVDMNWSYSKIYEFLETHFKFLFHYFATGPDADQYKSNAPFLVVNKSRHTLRAVSGDLLDLNGDLLSWNAVVPAKYARRMWRLWFGKSCISILSSPCL